MALLMQGSLLLLCLMMVACGGLQLRLSGWAWCTVEVRSLQKIFGILV